MSEKRRKVWRFPRQRFVVIVTAPIGITETEAREAARNRIPGGGDSRTDGGLLVRVREDDIKHDPIPPRPLADVLDAITSNGICLVRKSRTQ